MTGSTWCPSSPAQPWWVAHSLHGKPAACQLCCAAAVSMCALLRPAADFAAARRSSEHCWLPFSQDAPAASQTLWLQVLSLAGAWRHYQQVAAGGVGMAGWLTPAAAQQQRGLQGQQQQQQQQQGQQQAAPLQNLTGVSC